MKEAIADVPNFATGGVTIMFCEYEDFAPLTDRQSSEARRRRSCVQAAVVKSADRTLDIFELLASEPNGLTISEISDRLGFRAGAARTALCTRCSRAAIYRWTEDGRFHLGVRLIQLGLNVADRLELRSAARGPLERLVASTHDTALLVVPTTASCCTSTR